MKTILVAPIFLLATFCAHASPERPTAGKNAFDPKLPQVEVTYKCLDQPEEKVKVARNQCLKEVKALKSIQCRPDWTKSRKTVDYFECAAKYSSGDFKTYYQRKADGTKAMIKQFGAAED
jgi:hypothetical protein